MLKCSPEAFAKCPNRLYCGSYPSECSFTEGSDCDKFNQSVEDSPKTNADRIRAMSDEELAKVFEGGFHCEKCSEGDKGKKNICDLKCEEHCLQWLKQSAEGE